MKQYKIYGLPELKEGDKVLIEVWNYKLKKTEWHPGTFISKVSADDREYRIWCRLDTGVDIRAAAPECVKKFKQ
jgi:hypothetical protein